MAVRLLKLGFEFAVWFSVPLIGLIALFLARSTAKRTDDKRRQAAMKSGFWAGFILFLIILIYQVGIFLQEGFPRNPIFQGINLWWTLGTALVGFFMFSGGKHMISPQLAGLGILLVVFLASYTVIHYLFIRLYNEVILSVTLGTTFGVLCHFAATPGAIRKALGGGR